jgi:hypothetical protein
MESYERWKLESTEREIMEYLDAGKKVFIESGALVDSVLGYCAKENEEGVRFITTASVFQKMIQLDSYSSVETEEFGGNLFVHVMQ